MTDPGDIDPGNWTTGELQEQERRGYWRGFEWGLCVGASALMLVWIVIALTIGAHP